MSVGCRCEWGAGGREQGAGSREKPALPPASSFPVSKDIGLFFAIMEDGKENFFEKSGMDAGLFSAIMEDGKEKFF
ncbi:MAG: hypothetical protein LBQ20_05205 [Rhodanobacter sp.]|jgi:hypothetical protein|nr:hypothetical protein [Rhodanobacter sp.]